MQWMGKASSKGKNLSPGSKYKATPGRRDGEEDYNATEGEPAPVYYCAKWSPKGKAKSDMGKKIGIGVGVGCSAFLAGIAVLTRHSILKKRREANKAEKDFQQEGEMVAPSAFKFVPTSTATTEDPKVDV